MTGRGAAADAAALADPADERTINSALDRVEELVHSDPVAAEKLADRCAAAAGSAGLDALRARAQYLRARVLAERGELTAALRLIDAAQSGWRRAGEPLSALRADLGRMHILDDLGRHEAAIAAGEGLLAELDQLPAEPDDGPRRWLAAAALDNLGVARELMGQHEQALRDSTRAEQIYRSLDMPGEAAVALANRGVALLRLGQARAARDALTSSAAEFAATGDRLWEAKCLGDIAKAQRQLGEVVEALAKLERARRTLDELGASAELARVHLATAEAYLSVGMFGEARAEAATAVDHTAAAGMVHDEAIARYTIAMAHVGSADPARAASELSLATELVRPARDGEFEAKLLMAQAEVAALQAQPEAAARLVAQASDALRAGGWLIPLAWATLRLADLAAPEAARQHLDQAAPLVAQLRLPQLDYHYRIRLARHLRRQGDTDRAEQLLRAAIDVIDRQGGDLPDAAMRVAFRADKYAAYDQLVDLLVGRMRPGDLAAAFRIADEGKAQTLLDMVTGMVGTSGHAAGPGALHKLDQRRADLNATYGTMFTTVDPSRRALLRERADRLDEEIGALRLRVTVAEPPIATVADPPIATAADPNQQGAGPVVVPASASPSSATTTLAYHIVGDDVLAFVQHVGDVTFHRLAGAVPAVDRELGRLNAQWSRLGLGDRFTSRHGSALVQTARTSLAALYDHLVAPLRLPDLPGLVIVPHRQLHHVPFHALHDGADHLCRRWPITVAPTVPGELPTFDWSEAIRNALVLAVPDANAPAAAAEAASVAEHLHAPVVLVGERATKDALRSELPGRRIVHIACHGLHRPANPMFSALRLADRWLTVTEILELDLAGSLVVLTACETGRHDRDAVEPVGIGWAFLAAGAAGAVVSRWAVHDQTSVALMGEFYAQLGAGAAPAQALRRAQLAAAARTPHPFYWAPFTYLENSGRRCWRQP